MQSTTDAYEQKIRGRMKELRAEIDKLSAKAEQADADVKIKSQRQLNAVQEKWQTLEHKLDEMKQSGAAAGRELRDGIAAAWEDLSGSLRAAKRKLQ